MDTRYDTASGELHATFVDSIPNGSHTLPVALPRVGAAGDIVGRLARRIPPVHTTCPSPTVTDHWAATHGPAMLYSQERGERDQLKW